MTKAITALVPFFGSSRIIGPHVGRLLSGSEWLGCPFAGGMCELAHVTARTLVVSDLHRHVINLAKVVADPGLNASLQERLDSLPFHPDVLEAAQRSCLQREAGTYSGRDCPLWWACDYFVTAWMARNATAGTDGEFIAGLSVRWDAGGGDSVVRFRNAIEALAEWQKIMARCTFVCLDAFDFLEKVKDREGHAVYCDCPWFDDGDRYRHKFSAEQQGRLAVRLAEFTSARVVVRAGDHPMVRQLYPESAGWRWHEIAGRTMANKAKAEVLIVRN